MFTKSSLSTHYLISTVITCFMMLTFVTETSNALPTDREQPLKISADSAIRDDALGETRYIGDVELQQGSLSIKADLLTINHSDSTASVVIAEGDPATLSQIPEANSAPVTAQARQIEYYRVEDKVVLRDDARIEQEGAIVTGAVINYLIKRRKPVRQAPTVTVQSPKRSVGSRSLSHPQCSPQNQNKDPEK